MDPERVVDQVLAQLPLKRALEVITNTPKRFRAQHAEPVRVYVLLAESEDDGCGISYPRLVRDEEACLGYVWKDYHPLEHSEYSLLRERQGGVRVTHNLTPRHHPILDLFAQTDQLNPEHRVDTVLLYPWETYEIWDDRRCTTKPITCTKPMRQYPPVSSQMVLRYIEYLHPIRTEWDTEVRWITELREAAERIERVIRWWRLRLI